MGDELKVLVVDDEREIRTLLRDELAAFGHRVVVADSGPKALRLIQAEDFDVVLLDLKMPDMDGLEVLKALKSGGVEIEVVILTGHADVESAVTAMKLGARDYLQKPWAETELERAVRQAAEFRREKRAVCPSAAAALDPRAQCPGVQHQTVKDQAFRRKARISRLKVSKSPRR